MEILRKRGVLGANPGFYRGGGLDSSNYSTTIYKTALLPPLPRHTCPIIKCYMCVFSTQFHALLLNCPCKIAELWQNVRLS